MKKICPLIKDECMEHGCTFYTHVIGMNPQTGANMDQWDCAVMWIPIMLIEGAKQTRGVQSSVDSMRNEVVQRQDELNAAVSLGVNRENPPLPAIDVTPRPDGLLDGP